MVDGSRLAEEMADFVATTPSSVAVRDLSEPPKAPKGVRFAATMNMLAMIEKVRMTNNNDDESLWVGKLWRQNGCGRRCMQASGVDDAK